MSKNSNPKLFNKSISTDFFSLFSLPQAFRLDEAALELRYRDMQSQVHPDRFATADEAGRRLSLQWATQVNTAYRTLKSPLERAKYLLFLTGHDASAETAPMAADFLMEHLEWREAAAEARQGGDSAELERLHLRLRADIARRHDELGHLLDDERDPVRAAEAVRRLMFAEKLLSEIDDALASLE